MGGSAARRVGGVWDCAELRVLNAVLAELRSYHVQFHGIRTRRAAARRFVSFHLLVPGAWPVQQAHELAERVEARLADLMPGVNAISHLEPIEDPASYADVTHDGPGVPPEVSALPKA